MHEHSSFEEQIARYMDDLCDHYGHDPRAVSWFSLQTQYRRFEVLASFLERKRESVLDVGCGQGDFFNFLRKRKIQVVYEGIDMSPKMIRTAKRLYPEGKFFVENIFNSESIKEYDYIVASGPFNYRFPNQDAYLKRAIDAMWKKAQRGIAFNLLSSTTPREQQYSDWLSYYQAQHVVEMCKELTPHVTLKEDYLPNDFTIYAKR